MSVETAEYCTWRAMKYRCNNPGAKGYHNYGGRGIRVCERWNNSFTTFLTDMGPRPDRQHTLERRDNNVGYCPSNCYWASSKEQNRNKRTNRFITVGDVTMNMADWSTKTGINFNTIRWRLDKMGLPPDVALDVNFDAGPRIFGESHPVAKLTDGLVIEIRRRAAAGETISALAREHGVQRKAIRAVVQRKTWKHV